MMNLVVVLTLSCAVGAALGWIHFRALWETVRRLPRLARPGSWVVASALLRLGISALVLVLIVRWGGLPALGGALLGFILVRTAFLRRSRRGGAQAVSLS